MSAANVRARRRFPLPRRTVTLRVAAVIVLTALAAWRVVFDEPAPPAPHRPARLALVRRRSTAIRSCWQIAPTSACWASIPLKPNVPTRRSNPGARKPTNSPVLTSKDAPYGLNSTRSVVTSTIASWRMSTWATGS